MLQHDMNFLNHSPISQLFEGLELIPRISSCPKCGLELDVSEFNPLDEIHCAGCQTQYKLLEKIDQFRLIQALPENWLNAFYLAERENGKGNALIIILSAQALTHHDTIKNFSYEAVSAYSKFDFEWIDDYSLKQEQGFSCFVIEFKSEFSEQHLLSVLGTSFHSEIQEKPPESAIITPCPKCQTNINVLGIEPLDQVICPSCNKQFLLHRQFANYRLDYRLNQGGTSIVYLAQDMNSGGKIALKILSQAEVERHPESIRNFIQEFELSQKLRHPNVIHVYSGGQYQGYYYMAMELIEGFPLDEILALIQGSQEKAKENTDSLHGVEQFKPALPELICLEIARRVAEGLGCAHQNGLVHGDVKPENIMLTYDGKVKVIDFGLIQFANAEKLLAEGEEWSILGTPFYIPPERVMGEPEDFRSDIYSLGATLYHLLRGIAPFRAKSAAEIAMMHASAPLIGFKAFVPWVSETTCGIVEKSLKKSVSERYLSHVEFVADLMLAKQLLLQTMPEEPTDGTILLKEFMDSIAPRKEMMEKMMELWKRATTTVIHTYRYALKAITKRVKKSDF